MEPSVIVEEVRRSSSRPFFSNGLCKLLELTSVYGTGDGAALREQLMKHHSPRIPEATKEILLGVEVRFGLRRRVFSTRGTVDVRVIEDATLIFSNKIFEKLLSMRANERLTDGYPGEPGAIRQGVKDPSSHVENGGVFDNVEAFRPGLVFEVGVFACEASEPVLDSVDGSGALAQSAVEVAGCCRCSNAATSFIEDGSSNLTDGDIDDLNKSLDDLRLDSDAKAPDGVDDMTPVVVSDTEESDSDISDDDNDEEAEST
ncbi:hypothetical protein RB195_024167 [Necator americanus]|uniref:Uncharacterized protein n=1 Tax=Necator americanus TaxID=51031 RepID=A0ABR1EM49_NECAM